jgi:hypothetical protein
VSKVRDGRLGVMGEGAADHSTAPILGICTAVAGIPTAFPGSSLRPFGQASPVA